MIKDDPSNSDVISSVLNEQELNNEPDQRSSRSIINFQDWSLEQAPKYPLPFQVVEEKVKPERIKQRDSVLVSTGGAFFDLV